MNIVEWIIYAAACQLAKTNPSFDAYHPAADVIEEGNRFCTLPPKLWG